VPIGTFLEGSYTLHLAPLLEGGVAREGGFIVTWSMEHLVRSARNTEIEIELLFDGQDRERLMAMPRAAQISALNAYWDSVDPTPGTAVNETYDAFQARVDYARRNYRDQAHPGPLSARGRVYIRYGPPAEIQVEVLPNNPDQLEEAIVKVHDEAQVDRHGSAVKEIVPLNRSREEAYQDLQRFVPGSAGEQAAFELWIYDMDGDRLVDDDGPIWTEGASLRFLFVDILGTGVYQLEFSNYPFRKD
jgi:GWxTD domain-containing protein